MELIRRSQLDNIWNKKEKTKLFFFYYYYYFTWKLLRKKRKLDYSRKLLGDLYNISREKRFENISRLIIFPVYYILQELYGDFLIIVIYSRITYYSCSYFFLYIVGSFLVMISRIIYLYIYFPKDSYRPAQSSISTTAFYGGFFISAALMDCVFNSSQSFYIV